MQSATLSTTGTGKEDQWIHCSVEITVTAKDVPGVDHHVAGGADRNAPRQRGVLHVHHGKVPAQALGEEEGGHAAPCACILQVFRLRKETCV